MVPAAPSWSVLPAVGTLAVYLLEPRSRQSGGLEFLRRGIKPGGDFPVSRLTKNATISLTGAAPLPESAGPPRPLPSTRRWRRWRPHARLRWRTALAGWRALAGRQEGRLMKVHSATGRAQPFVDAKALAKGLHDDLARPKHVQSIAGRTSYDMDPAKRGSCRERTGPLLRNVRRFPGGSPHQPSGEQFAQFSPDGKSSRLCANSICMWLTCRSDGTPVDNGGRDDCVTGMPTGLFREIFNRRWPAFWWSPTPRSSPSWSSTMPASRSTLSWTNGHAQAAGANPLSALR